MRFAMVLAAVAALWIQPVEAATMFTLDFESDAPGAAPFEPQGIDLYESPVVRAGGPTGNYVELASSHWAVETAILNFGFVTIGDQLVRNQLVSFDVMASSDGHAIGDSVLLPAGEWVHVINPFSNGMLKLHAGVPTIFAIDNLVFSRVSIPLPEPGTWAMMILGMGFVGGALRRRRRHPPLRTW